MYLLGIDVGTTSVKAVIFDEGGRRISKAVEEYSLTPLEGRSERRESVMRLKPSRFRVKGRPL